MQKCKNKQKSIDYCILAKLKTTHENKLCSFHNKVCAQDIQTKIKSDEKSCKHIQYSKLIDDILNISGIPYLFSITSEKGG